MQAEIAATTGPEVLEEHGADLVDQGLTGADLPGDVDPPAAPADQPLEGVREPEEADDLIRQVQEGRPVDPCVPEVPGGGVQPVVARGRDLVRSLASPAALSATTETGGAGRVVSDQAWEWMETLLPATSTGRRGGRWRDHRQVVEAISWKYRTGSPWRELPARFGPWQTAYERLSRWGADGTWARLLARAQTDADAAGELDWLVAVESAVARAHQHGPTPRRVGSDAATASPDDPKEGVAA
jgi:putative transposase